MSAQPGSRRRRVRWSCVAAVVALWLSLQTSPAGLAAQRTVSFRTEDGINITAAWYEPSERPAPAVILIHMLNGTRRDWEAVAAGLAADGIGALAIDLRGHGESGGSPAELATMVRDVSAARRYLATRADVQPSRIGFAGASLGANLAALAAAEVPASSIALLSPSLDYRGLRIEAAVRKYGSRPALLVAGTDDAYAGRTVKDLKQAGRGVRELLILSGAGHGTAMLSRNADLSRALVDWFRRTL